jgi:plasmid stability protein
MATLTIHNLEESLMDTLRMRAASRNRSMEEEARQILRETLAATPVPSPVPSEDLASRIRSRLVGLGDVKLIIPKRR